MALMIGFVLVLVLGIAHHCGLLAVRAIKPHPKERPRAAIMVAFSGLIALHTLEILAFAVVYRALLAWGSVGDLGGGFDTS